MKVVHISNSDSGGAGLAALRLHKSLIDAGIQSSMLCLNSNSNTKDVITYPKNTLSKIVEHSGIAYQQNRYRKFIRDHQKDYEALSFPDAIYDISKHKLIQEADIINLHWVGSMLNYHSFFSSVKQPIVWTLHDMNPFLGCAHYMGDIIKNPQHTIFEERLQIKKQKAIQQHQNITIVTLCNWMKECSQNSKSFQTLPHEIIPNSVNTSIFKHYNKEETRKALNIPSNKPILLFVSQHINNPRKGFDLLLETIKDIKEECLFIAIGCKDANLSNAKNILYFDSIKDELLMALIYSVADAFILPSREDNLPNTMLESLCCGVPVITTPIGGMLDIISPMKNGILTDTIDAQSLQKAIYTFLENRQCFDSRKISEEARKRFAPTSQAQSYIQLYRKLIRHV